MIKNPAINQPPRKLHLLIVDDNRIVVMVMQRMLADYDELIVDKANDGREALIMLQKQVYDILITDYQMPYLNGPELANKARELQPNIFVVLTSGYPPKRLEMLLEARQINHYLPKPPGQEDLLAMLMEAQKNRPLANE